jgi:hypothetical protein
VRRWIASVLVIGIALPPLATALMAVLPAGAAIASCLLVAVLGVPALARRLSLLETQPRGRVAVWLVLCALAAVQSVRLSTFMHDARRESCSVFPPPGLGPIQPGFVHHACMSAYTEAARLSRQGVANLYALENYVEKTCEPGRTSECVPRKIGPIEVDLYEYPPPFLLLPRAATAITEDFFTLRALWFAVQFALLAAAGVFTARWIGGDIGRRALWFLPALGIAIPVQLGLQLGNFQIAVFALSMLAMLLFARGRDAAGGALLGFVIVSKLFPGVLLVYLLGKRRYRAFAWTAGFAALFTVLAFLLVGLGPFEQFLHYQLPRMTSGEAFPWLDESDSLPVNYSIYALVMNLRSLGVAAFDHRIATGAASLYGLFAIAVAAFAGHRQTPAANEAQRAREAQTWLALLTLGSLRSPFAPDGYAMAGTLWLLTLIAAAEPALSRRQIAGLIFCAVVFSVVLDNNIPPHPHKAVVIFALLRQALALSVNLWVVFGRLRGAPASTYAFVTTASR